MRLASALLVSVIALGCGNGSGAAPQGNIRSMTLSPPAISDLFPTSTPVNSVPFFLTVDGTNFLPDAIVVWNGTALHTTFVTSKQLMAALNSTDLQSVGPNHVYVRTGGLNSNTVNFDVTSQ